MAADKGVVGNNS